MFTMTSMYGFCALGKYDPSRMASNVASGVGFIGAGVITTTGSSESSSNSKNKKSGGGGSIVHGLTTAAAIWLSAATGVGCGVGLCVISTAAAVLTVTILRIGRVAQNFQEKLQLREDLLNNSNNNSMDRLLWRNNNNNKQREGRQWHRSSKPKHKVTYDDDEEEEMLSSRRSSNNKKFPEDSTLYEDSLFIRRDNDHKHQPENDLDLYEDSQDQLVFHDERPDTGWNETDKMDA